MRRQQLDRSTVIGVLVAASGIIVGLLLDGGSIRQVVQPTAMLIVLGGTIGAVMIQFPMSAVRDAVNHLRCGLVNSDIEPSELIEELGGYCSRARRHGLLSLDAQLNDIEDVFLRKALTLGIDGFTTHNIRDIMEADLSYLEERDDNIPKVFEAAGGFSPTLGIVGAVLGLIQVMQRMDNVGEIGKGIAVAFVSTLYGIGLANLVFLPMAGKLRIRFRERQMMREITLEAVIAIVDGINPLALRQRLASYDDERRVIRSVPKREIVTR